MNSARRYQSPLVLVLRSAIVLMILLPAAVLGQLAYLDCTPSGPGFPEWDGGNTGLCFADLNGDGKVDFVSIGDHGSPYINTDQHGIMVYFGDGAGDWSIHMEGHFGYGGIATGDVNNDGWLDVGYGMHHDYSSGDLGDQLIEVALGDGSGTAWTAWDDGLATSGEDWGMFATVLADFDADGDLDLASNSFGCCNGIRVYLSGGDGSWSHSWTRSGGNSGPLLCSADINGDGYPDLAASYQHGTIWLGDGAGSFQRADDGLPEAGSLGHGGVALGDVDDDGRADLAFVQAGVPRVYLWRGDQWEPANEGLPSSGDYVLTQLWDMDGDGFVDLVALGDGTLTIWRGDGTGTWTPNGGHDAPPAVDTQALATGGDIDHNGRADLVFLQEEGSWPSYQNHLYALREANAPELRSVLAHFPRGGATLRRGAVTTLRWSSAWIGEGEGRIDIELATDEAGEAWMTLVNDLPDSGHWQWIVSGDASDTCRLRLTLHQGGEEVRHVGQLFRILPGVTTAVGEDAATPAEQREQLVLLSNPVRTVARFRWQDAQPKNTDGPRSVQHPPELGIYNLAGRLIARCLVSGMVDGQWSWNLRDGRGKPVAGGVYLAQALNEAGRPQGPARRFVVLR